MRYEIIVGIGGSSWIKNDKYHREYGPTIEWATGSREWWFNDKHHRLDGPAVEYKDGKKAWYINDKRYTEEKFLQISPAFSTM